MHKKFDKEVNHLDDTAEHVWLLYYWDQRVSSATCLLPNVKCGRQPLPSMIQSV